MDNRVFVSVDTSTANTPSPFEHFYSIMANSVTADITAICVVCEEFTPMNSNDLRAHSVFICNKCKAAIKHVRASLENT